MADGGQRELDRRHGHADAGSLSEGWPDSAGARRVFSTVMAIVTGSDSLIFRRRKQLLGELHVRALAERGSGVRIATSTR